MRALPVPPSFVAQRICVADSGKAKRTIATLRIAVLRADVSHAAAQVSFSREPHCAVHVTFLDEGTIAGGGSSGSSGSDGGGVLKHRVGKIVASEASHRPDFQQRRDKEVSSSSARSMAKLTSAISQLREQAKAMLSESAGSSDAALQDVLERWTVDPDRLVVCVVSDQGELIAAQQAKGVEVDVALPSAGLLAFKYPVLQPIEKSGGSGHRERPLPWASSRASLHFELSHEEIGRAHV